MKENSQRLELKTEQQKIMRKWWKMKRKLSDLGRDKRQILFRETMEEVHGGFRAIFKDETCFEDSLTLVKVKDFLKQSLI